MSFGRRVSAGCFEYRGEFSTEENTEAILDLFDVYCSVQEIIAEEGLKSPILAYELNLKHWTVYNQY